MKLTRIFCVIFALSGASQAMALDAGDWILRGGATGVFTQGINSDPVSTAATGPIPGSEVGPDDAWALGITIGYAFTPSISLELLLATPFKHDIQANNTLRSALMGAGLAGTENIGEVTQLPPTLSVNYTFNPQASVRPYVGAGINYFKTFDEEVTGDLATAGYTNLDVDDSWGVAFQGGVDFDVNDKVFLNASIRWMDIDVDATATGGALGTITVDNIGIDPWVFSLMVGTTF